MYFSLVFIILDFSILIYNTKMNPEPVDKSIYLHPSHSNNSSAIFVTGFEKFGSHAVNPT
jgi:hypothetical protein